MEETVQKFGYYFKHFVGNGTTFLKVDFGA